MMSKQTKVKRAAGKLKQDVNNYQAALKTAGLSSTGRQRLYAQLTAKPSGPKRQRQKQAVLNARQAAKLVRSTLPAFSGYQRRFGKTQLLPSMVDPSQLTLRGSQAATMAKLVEEMNTFFGRWCAQILASSGDWRLHYQLPGLPTSGVQNFNSILTTTDFTAFTVTPATDLYSRLEGDSVSISRYSCFNGLVNTQMTIPSAWTDLWLWFDYQDNDTPMKWIAGFPGSVPWIATDTPANYSQAGWTNNPFSLTDPANFQSASIGYGSAIPQQSAVLIDSGSFAYMGGCCLTVQVTNQTAYTAVSMRAVSDPDMIERFIETLDADSLTNGDIGMETVYQMATAGVVQGTGSKWFAPIQKPPAGPYAAYWNVRLYDALRNGFPMIQLQFTNSSASPSANLVLSITMESWIGQAPRLRSKAGAQPHITTSLHVPDWVRSFRNIGSVGMNGLSKVDLNVRDKRVIAAVSHPGVEGGVASKLGGALAANPAEAKSTSAVSRPGIGPSVANIFRGLAGDLISSVGVGIPNALARTAVFGIQRLISGQRQATSTTPLLTGATSGAQPLMLT